MYCAQERQIHAKVLLQNTALVAVLLVDESGESVVLHGAAAFF